MFSIMFVSFALNVASPDLTKSLTTLKDAHVLFSASSERIASFSAQEWDSWFRAVTKVQRNYNRYHCFHSLISSHRLSIMRMFFNFLRPWKLRMLLFAVPRNFCLMLSATLMLIRFLIIFQNSKILRWLFLQRVENFISKHSHVELLLRAYRTARSLLSRNEDGVLVIHRVMDFCSECADISQKC